MSYTILTIPFNLKEKEGDKYLSNGFVFDDVLPEFFEGKEAGNSFLHIATFNNSFVKKNVINLFLEENFPEFEFTNKVNGDIFASTTFFDSNKYLNSSQAYVKASDFRKLNIKNKPKIENELLTIPYDSLNIDYSYQKDFKSQSIANFEIVEIKLFVNRLASSMDSIGFGYVEIVLKWNFDDAITMIENLAPLSELFRFYGEDNNNKFDVFGLNNNSWTAQVMGIIDNFLSKNENPKIPVTSKIVINQNIEKIRKICKENNFKKLDFKSIVDKLLGNITKQKTVEEIFSFNHGSNLSKPYVLHLANLYGHENESINLDGSEINSKVHRLLRIASSGNSEINKTSKLLSVSPDMHTKQFIFNEGAFAIEGSKTVSELLNKYYPTFLFALNQKYLFHYIQGKINELPLDEKSQTYKPEALKTLQQTMIYAEFSQIFTSLSNYNEIDMFFEKLRDQFKIDELKKEYLASIDGISRITQINEDEKKEETEKLNSSRLNLILLLLTIAQVWPNIYELFHDKKEKLWVNVIFYFLIISVGIYFYYIHLPIKSKSGNISWRKIKEILNKTFKNKKTL
jgi:hypothetical protein